MGTSMISATKKHVFVERLNEWLEDNDNAGSFKKKVIDIKYSCMYTAPPEKYYSEDFWYTEYTALIIWEY